MIDPFDADRARRAPRLLGEFNGAGILAAADVHVALRLTALAGADDPLVALATALAVRAPRLGHVYVDLATIRDTAGVDAEEPVELAALPWPRADLWIESLRRSGLVALGEADTAALPLRLLGERLYLDRYWREERTLAADLRGFAAAPARDVRTDLLAAGLGRLFGDAERSAGDERQRLGAAAAVLHRFAVLAGGPGTGKTTTVARVVALLAEQAAATGRPAPLVALAAPTGKAAARLEAAVHDEARTLAVAGPVRALLLSLGAATLHRLLGRRARSHGRFHHHRGNPLAHDVVIVDEVSMVSLSLMARLVEAVRPDARLILVGDAGQLSSIEAGAVLGDIVGPAADGPRMRPAARAALAAVTGIAVPATERPGALGDGIVVLERVHRFGAGIAALATAVRDGDADRAVALLADAPDGVDWLRCDAAAPEAARIEDLRADVVTAARATIELARAGDARAALDSLGAVRVLCAHRRGPYGVAAWQARIEDWLAREVDGLAAAGAWYAGRPLLVTENDYGLRLYNGDVGVVVASGPDRVAAAFERRGQLIEIGPARLGAVETVHALTVHKSQGSQFDAVVVALPAPSSRVLTRELLYTAITRARARVVVLGEEASVRAAIARPAARASGLRARLWEA